jgi:hypothetical protein
VRDQVSHPYKTTGKIIVLYILIFTCLNLNCMGVKIFLSREREEHRRRVLWGGGGGYGSLGRFA